MDDFVDIWGSDLESEAVEGLLRALNRMPFSVEDFDDLEGMAVTSCEVVDAGSFRLHYYFDIKALIWTISMDSAFADANAERLHRWSIDRRSMGVLAAVDTLQHRYLRGRPFSQEGRNLHGRHCHAECVPTAAFYPRGRDQRIRHAPWLAHG